jgi:1,4-alpha-glucan branching enzyme
MGWMHDTLDYISKDPVHRRYHHNELTFRMIYAYHENFVLPLSHDEVVHGKGSLLARMPGDDWQKFANLRLLLGYMYAQPGKKLLFMGGEIGQWQEWYHEESLQWHLLQYEPHAGIQRWVRDLNQTYRNEPALYELDCDPAGFQWIDGSDMENSVLSFVRRGSDKNAAVLVVCNFTPVVRQDHRIGVPVSGNWTEILNGDATVYGGSGQYNGTIEAAATPFHGQLFSLNLTLPPLSTIFLKPAL